MENWKTFKSLGLVVFLFVSAKGKGQVSQLNNTVTAVTDYIGCDVNSNQPLRFTTQLNFPHQWRTDNALRMRLTQTLTGQSVNG
ncbi:MAG: hypothetical protein IPK70_02340 [Flavobacteriales bacterium]|jgi:hypothetical protein|nr:hypothetical protein [Flavobacteriales bacterium]